MKRVAIKRDQILSETRLFIDEEQDDDANQADEFDIDSEIEDQGFPRDEIDYELGPHGEVYPSSSSGEEMVEIEEGQVEPKRFFMPRCK